MESPSESGSRARMLFSLIKPTPGQLAERCRRHRDSPFSYAPTHLTREPPSRGYNVDRYEVALGQGRPMYERAVDLVRRWAPLRLKWTSICTTHGTVDPDATIAVAARVFGLWTLNLCRVVYVDEEPGRFAFAYGTLQHHVEQGEEGFAVERDPASGVVRLRIVAVSRPRHPIARLAYPISRRTQARFGRDALAAMRRAITAGTDPRPDHDE